MSPKAPSPAWGDPLSCHPLFRVLSPKPPGMTPSAELLTLLVAGSPGSVKKLLLSQVTLEANTGVKR